MNDIFSAKLKDFFTFSSQLKILQNLLVELKQTFPSFWALNLYLTTEYKVLNHSPPKKQKTKQTKTNTWIMYF